MSTQCLGGCGFFASENGYCSKCKKTAQQAADDSRKCRLQCGFYGCEECYGLCSACFAPLRKDPWLLAITATCWDQPEGVVQFVSNGGDVKRNTTEADVEQAKKFHAFVDAHCTLVQIAAQRNSNSVMMYLLSLEEAAAVSPHHRRGALSSLASHIGFDEAMEREVREELLSTSAGPREDGLQSFVFGDLPSRTAYSYALPTFLLSLDAARRDKVLHYVTEQSDMTHDVEAALAHVERVTGGVLFPLYTPADLNCLLHGATMSMCGLKDMHVDTEADVTDVDGGCTPRPQTRTPLRETVYQAFVTCAPLIQVVCEDDHRLVQILHEVEQAKASLEGGCVFALSNILRRPIVMYAALHVEGEMRAEFGIPFRVSGVYLPLLWPPEETFMDPLALCYSRGHFTALVGFGDPGSAVRMPLCDEQLKPLPVHYVPSGEAGATLKRYLRNVTTVAVPPTDSSGKAIEVLVCDQLIQKPPEGSKFGAYFESLRESFTLRSDNLFGEEEATNPNEVD